MESMRSLNRSLPKSSPKPRSSKPPEQLLQAFKTAALSVTNLYKRAASDQTLARQAGYQDALDNLLTFLDKENLGLGDGEGWRVRQWATERLDGTPPMQASSDSDDDHPEGEKRGESPSPVRQRKESPEIPSVQPSSGSGSPIRVEAAPQPSSTIPTSQPSNVSNRSEVFTFRSAHPFPQDVDMQASEIITSPTPHSETSLPPPLSTNTSAVRLEVVSRGSRTPHRHGHHSNRHNTRSTASVKALGPGVGSKRKATFDDFFNLGNLGDVKDGNGGTPKRGRLG